MADFPYPWTTQLWQQTRAAHRRLPHGLLLCGPDGVGKVEFAFALARAELCNNSYEADDVSAGCGDCQSCKLFDSGSHPDFHFLASELLTEALPPEMALSANRHLPERPRSRKLASALISVDRIRHLNETLSLRAFGTRKFALIAPADGMNIQAFNALLKLLEEPPEQTRMVLVSARVFKLPATIRSRTSRVHCRAPGRDQAVSWLYDKGVDKAIAGKLLTICGGGPLRALSLYQSGFPKVLAELESAVISIVEGDRTASDLAGAWTRRSKEGVSAEEVIPILRSILDDLARRVQIPSLSGQDELQAVVPGLHLKQLHQASLDLSALAAGWDSVLDNTLLLEQAFTAVNSVRA